MTNYDDMSEFQIDVAVARAQGKKHTWYEECFSVEKGASVKHCVCCPDTSSVELPNYCNNPSDMWPIIVEHNILIRPRPETDIGKPFASDIRGIHLTRCIDNNGLLRAAAIVYLKMEAAKNEKS